MHILFLTDNFPPETNAPASRTFEHAQRWRSHGHKVTIVTTAPNFPAGKLIAGHRNRIWQRETLDGIDVIRLWTYITANEGFLRRTLDYLSFMIAAILATPFLPRADVLVTTSPQFFTPCAGYVVSRLKRLPWVFELRDLWPDSIVAVGAMREGVLLGLLRWVEYFLYRKAAHVICLTQSFRQVLIDNGISPSKLSFVPNGVDLRAFQPKPAPIPLLEQWKLRDRFVVGYIGTVGMAHGLGTILEAAKVLLKDPGITFLIVGTGAERARLEARAQDEGLTNVIFAGHVSKGEVLDYWAVCNVAAVLLKDTLVFETVLPSKMFEAMAMQRPIILGVRGESARLLLKAGAGIAISPESTDEFVAAILKLRSDAAAAKSMGERGRATVVNSFDRDELARQMLERLASISKGDHR